MPPNTVKVDRSSPWGNPFRVAPPKVKSVEHSVELFKEWIESTPEGKALADRAERTAGEEPGLLVPGGICMSRRGAAENCQQ